MTNKTEKGKQMILTKHNKEIYAMPLAPGTITHAIEGFEETPIIGPPDATYELVYESRAWVVVEYKNEHGRDGYLARHKTKPGLGSGWVMCSERDLRLWCPNMNRENV